jgi:hypothetical protein
MIKTMETGRRRLCVSAPRPDVRRARPRDAQEANAEDAMPED